MPSRHRRGLCRQAMCVLYKVASELALSLSHAALFAWFFFKDDEDSSDDDYTSESETDSDDDSGSGSGSDDDDDDDDEERGLSWGTPGRWWGRFNYLHP